MIQYMWFLGGTSSRVTRGDDEIVSQVGGGEASGCAVDQEAGGADEHRYWFSGRVRTR